MDLIAYNILSPVVLAFALGIVATLARSDLRFPEPIYAALSIYLLLAIGLKGGAALGETSFSTLLRPVVATLLLSVITPITAYLVLRRLLRFSIVDAAAIAAHYGSVSAVTFIATLAFVDAVRAPAEPYMPALVAILEVPAIIIAIAIARGRPEATSPAVAANGPRAGDPGETRSDESVARSPAPGAGSGPWPSGGSAPEPVAHDIERGTWREAMHEILAGRSVLLLLGGVAIGWLSGPTGMERVAPFFVAPFQGVLTLFLLELGMVAARRFQDLRRVGAALAAFAIVVPILHGFLGVLLGRAAGLSLGGATVLGVLAGSASYIAAPAAVRISLPDANPSYYLTASLGITFPFNLAIGIPLQFAFARFLYGG